MQNSEQLFTLALGLNKPWSIKNITLDKESSRLYIYLEFIRSYKFKMYDGEEYTAHDAVERTWQHLNFFQYKCCLHAKIPKVKQSDGKIKTQAVP